MRRYKKTYKREVTLRKDAIVLEKIKATEKLLGIKLPRDKPPIELSFYLAQKSNFSKPSKDKNRQPRIWHSYNPKLRIIVTETDEVDNYLQRLRTSIGVLVNYQQNLIALIPHLAHPEAKPARISKSTDRFTMLHVAYSSLPLLSEPTMVFDYLLDPRPIPSYLLIRYPRPLPKRKILLPGESFSTVAIQRSESLKMHETIKPLTPLPPKTPLFVPCEPMDGYSHPTIKPRENPEEARLLKKHGQNLLEAMAWRD